MNIRDIISLYGSNSIVQLNEIPTGDRLISHDYIVEANGNVIVRVNGDLLENLVTETLFRQ